MTLASPIENQPFWWERADLGYHGDKLFFAGCDVSSLAAKADAPVFVYSQARVKDNLGRVLHALAHTGCQHRVFYAMKANRFAPLLSALAQWRRCGVDICSPNELDHALACGFRASEISFTGAGVSNRDLDRLLAHPALTITCDTIGAIRRIGERAPGRDIGIRINPSIGVGYEGNARLTYAGAQTTKFGVYREQWKDALTAAAAHDLTVTSLHFHVGCGYLNRDLEAWEQSLQSALGLLADLPDIRTVNIGGGLGLPHKPSDAPLDLIRWASILRRHFEGRGLTIAVEPGDFIVKDAGLLALGVTDIERKADTLFAFVDGGFNLHPEPVFYGLPCEPAVCRRRDSSPSDWKTVTIAGNINEAQDLWAQEVRMPPLREGDHIAFLNAGGYGASMSSDHCMRGVFEEVLI